MLEAIECDLAQLRKEVGGLRAEVLVLREEQRGHVDRFAALWRCHADGYPG